MDSQTPVVTPVHRHREQVVIDRFGAPVPTDRCFKCNCVASHEVRKTFADTGGKLRLFVALQPLLIPFLIPFHLLNYTRTSVAFGLCEKCQERRWTGLALGALFLLASIPMLVHGVLTITGGGLVLTLGGTALFGAGLLTMIQSRHLADAEKVDGRWIVLRGGGERFLTTLPQVDSSAS